MVSTVLGGWNEKKSRLCGRDLNDIRGDNGTINVLFLKILLLCFRRRFITFDFVLLRQIAAINRHVSRNVVIYLFFLKFCSKPLKKQNDKLGTRPGSTHGRTINVVYYIVTCINTLSSNLAINLSIGKCVCDRYIYNLLVVIGSRQPPFRGASDGNK